MELRTNLLIGQRKMGVTTGFGVGRLEAATVGQLDPDPSPSLAGEGRVVVIVLTDLDEISQFGDRGVRQHRRTDFRRT